MGLDMWFKPDVARIIDGLEEVAVRIENDVYRGAYLDALNAVRRSFGVEISAGTTVSLRPGEWRSRDS